MQIVSFVIWVVWFFCFLLFCIQCNVFVCVCVHSFPLVMWCDIYFHAYAGIANRHFNVYMYCVPLDEMTVARTIDAINTSKNSEREQNNEWRRDANQLLSLQRCFVNCWIKQCVIDNISIKDSNYRLDQFRVLC